MRYANIVVQRERGNRIFQPGAGPNGGDFFLPWQQLRERFAREGIVLNTRDVNAGRAIAFEFHLNAQRKLPVLQADTTTAYIPLPKLRLDHYPQSALCQVMWTPVLMVREPLMIRMTDFSLLGCGCSDSFNFQKLRGLVECSRSLPKHRR